MTEQRLKEIFIETVFPTIGVTDETLLWFETASSRQDYIEAMKRAVNEVLEEAADEADFTDETYSSSQEGSTFEIDKQTILNLKVK